MIRSFIVTIFLLCTNFLIYAQADSNLITWNKYERLKWEDYQGKPENIPADAVTSSGLYFDYSYDGDSILIIKVISQFQKKSSWVKPGKNDSRILRHEQLHFDITELNARLLRKYFSDVTYNKQIHFDIMLPRMYKEYLKKVSLMQNMYDVDTQHGNDTLSQGQYETNIAKQLSELSKYEKSTLVFKLLK